MSGRGFLYVLVAAGPDDLLKVGMTHAPLPRWSAFHRRWFEAFDLDGSLLVATETRTEAQALETALHRRLIEHACPVPLTMQTAAGGATEWFRGAYTLAGAFVDDCAARGHVVHRGARALLAPAMREQAAKLDGLARAARELQAGGWLRPEQRAALRDLLDAHRAFGADVDDLVDAGLRRELGLDG